MNLFILCQFYGLLQQVLPSVEEGGGEGITSELEFWGEILPLIYLPRLPFTSFPLPLLCVKPEQCVFILICSNMLTFHLPKSKELKSAITVSLKILFQLPKLLGTQPKETYSPLAKSI